MLPFSRTDLAFIALVASSFVSYLSWRFEFVSDDDSRNKV